MKNPILHFIVSLVILASCSPVLYSPTTQNVPLLKEKGAVNIGGGFSSTPEADGISINFAVAVDSSWAVAAGFNSLTGGEKNTPDYWDGKAKYFEAAFGKFGSSKHGPWIYETFLGLGYASVKNKQGNNIVNGGFIKPYLQPSIGIRSKFVDIAVTPRLAMVQYVSDHIQMNDPQDKSSVIYFFEDKRTSMVFEPGLTLKLGVKNVKLLFQYVYSTFSYSYDTDPFNNNMVTVGLNFYPK